MRFEVRNSGGTLYGSIDVMDINFLRHPPVRYCRALNRRFHGTGYRLLAFKDVDPSFQTIDFGVREWSTRPCIGEFGGYYPGRVDFVLIWDGPVDVLRDIPAFEEVP